MASNTVILVIPGSFSTAQMYYSMLNSVETLSPSTTTYVANLPSAIRNAPEPAATLADDASFFRGVIEKLADQGKDVILVAHSLRRRRGHGDRGREQEGEGGGGEEGWRRQNRVPGGACG